MPLKSKEAIEIAKSLIDNIITRYGAMQYLLSDLAKEFVGQIAAQLHEVFSIRKLNTTPYHPECNGLNEKFNGTLTKMINALAQERVNNWDTLIPYALMAYRSAFQESLHDSPYNLLFGRDMS